MTYGGRGEAKLNLYGKDIAIPNQHDIWAIPEILREMTLAKYKCININNININNITPAKIILDIASSYNVSLFDKSFKVSKQLNVREQVYNS